MKKKKFNLFNWLFDSNPIFALLLGMCTTLAVSTTFEKSLIMGVSVTFVLFFSSIIVSLIAKYITDELRIPAYIIIIATFVTVIEMLLKTYAFSIYDALGVYLPLITVNCIILGRVLAFAAKNKVVATMKDSLKVGAQYIFAITLLGTIREVLGNNSITIMDNLSKLTGYKFIVKIFPSNYLIPNNIFISSAGAFITLGIIIGILNKVRSRGDTKWV